MRSFTRSPAPPTKTAGGFPAAKPDVPSQVVLKKVNEPPDHETESVELGEFKPGDFVRNTLNHVAPATQNVVSPKKKITKALYEPLLPWGCEAGVVVAQSANKEWVVVRVNSIQDEFEYNRPHMDLLYDGKIMLLGKPRYLHRRVSFVSTSLLSKHDVVPNSFPIMDLPLTALAIVLHSLGTVEASWASMTCKRFLCAFRHELLWKAKTVSVVGPDVVVDAGSDWFRTYRDKAFWTITVVTVFWNRGVRSVKGKFSVSVNPKCTIMHLLDLLDMCRQNRQATRGRLGVSAYKPHDPSRLGRRDVGGFVSNDPSATPNCRFDVYGKDLSISTVAEAGLCNGAMLETEAQMKVD